MKALRPQTSARHSRNPFVQAVARSPFGDREAASRSVRRAESTTAPFPLDLYHLMGVFTICCMLGLAGETVVSYFVDGRWESRAGFLWGPFSPIYGVGGVLMTLVLRPIDRSSITVLFGVAAFAGGCFEWVASWFWENAFGIVAWSYLDQPFNIGGRTCLGIALVWGAAGIAWVKAALPLLKRILDKLPVAWRRAAAASLLAFFLVDAAVTLVAFDCWMNRLAGEPVTGCVQEFFAAHYDDDAMQSRFQTMSVYPGLVSLRG